MTRERKTSAIAENLQALPDFRFDVTVIRKRALERIGERIDLGQGERFAERIDEERNRYRPGHPCLVACFAGARHCAVFRRYVAEALIREFYDIVDVPVVRRADALL